MSNQWNRIQSAKIILLSSGNEWTLNFKGEDNSYHYYTVVISGNLSFVSTFLGSLDLTGPEKGA